MKCPYDDSVVQDWFTKEKDFILWVKGYGSPIMAALFQTSDNDHYQWMETYSGDDVPHDLITHYMLIPD